MSSSSVTPSVIGSMSSSLFDKNTNKFKINIIEPMDMENHTPLRTLVLKDINKIQEINQTLHSTPKSNIKPHKNSPLNRLASLIKLQRMVKGFLARK